MNAPQNEPRVAVLVDTATGWGRRLVHGVLMYSNQRGAWNVVVEARGQDEPLRLPPGWDGDGVIARISTESLAVQLQQHQPVVNVSAVEIAAAEAYPQVISDTEACVELAVQHFQDRGLRRFAYCSLESPAHHNREYRSFVAYHQSIFAKRLSKLGFDLITYAPKRGCGPRAAWAKQIDSLKEWLSGLPKPIGILAWAVRSGTVIINACHELGLRIPDEVCVMGGDDDDLLCEACQPPLTGIDVPAEQIGLESAKLLDKLMAGGASPKQTRMIKPTGVVERLSTDTLAIDDPDLVMAVRFIRNNADKILQVDDVVDAVHVSRRSLERQFASTLNRSIREEISRVHLQRAERLLAQTDLPIPAVADASGYRSPEYFATVFKASYGVTPYRYRAQLRGR